MIKSQRIRPGILIFLLAAGMVFTMAGCSNGAADSNLQNSTRSTSTFIPTRLPTIIPTASPKPDPDIHGESFSIHVILSDEDPFDEVTRVIRAGLEDFTAYQNSHGGVNGAKLELVFPDVGASGDEVVDAFETISAEEDVLVVLIAAPVDQALYDLINTQDVPVINFGLGAEGLEFAEEDDRLFWLVPAPEQQLAFWLDYALKNWALLRPEGQFDVMRLTHIGWEQHVEQEELRERSAALRAVVEGQNIVLASAGELNPSPSASASNAILDGVFNQATMIYLDLCGSGPAAVLNDLAYLDLEGMFNLAGGSWALGTNLEAYFPNPDGGPAIYTPLPIAGWSETGNPGIEAAGRIFRTAGRDPAEKELAYLYALAGMDLTAAALEHALVEQRGESRVELSAEGVYQALSELEDYEVLGGLMVVDFSGGGRIPREMRVWKYLPGEGLSLESGWLPLVEIEP